MNDLPNRSTFWEAIEYALAAEWRYIREVMDGLLQ